MFHVSTMLPYTPNNKQQVRAPCVISVSSPLSHFPQKPKWQVYKILNWNWMLHLSQQQEALYFVEVGNSEWAENKWRDTNSRLTASWMAFWINRLLFTHGDWGFHEIWREQVEIMVIRWLCRVSKNTYEWVKFHLKRPMYKARKYWCFISGCKAGILRWGKIKCQWDPQKMFFLTYLSG